MSAILYCHVCEWVTIDGLWIDDRIYWALWYSARLHFTFHCYTHTSIHNYVCTSRYSVAASNSWRSPSSGFPNYPRPQLLASHSNSSQRLTLSSSLSHWLTDYATHQPTQLPTNCPAYNISARITQKTLSLLLCNCCRGNMLVRKTDTKQRLLYSCFCGRCRATGLCATVYKLTYATP
jgi:hypothetical protein